MNKEESKGLKVLRVKPTPAQFPTNNLYTPMGNTPLHSISSVCHPWGDNVVVAHLLKKSALQPHLIDARALHRRYYPHTENGGLSCRLSSRLSLSVGFSMDVA